MSDIKAIWLKPLEPALYRFRLRRYHWREGEGANHLHDASAAIGDHGAEFAPKLSEGRPVWGDHWPHDDPRWPTKCSSCEYLFVAEDEWQLISDELYERSDGAGICTLRDPPEGAIWDAWWMGEWCSGPDGRSLHARVPGGRDWCIDGRASNCDSPCAICGVAYKDHTVTGWQPGGHHYQDARPHKCWIRHGEPPELTVDKNGVTCGAGAGSIATDNWHGFLIAGYFRSC